MPISDRAHEMKLKVQRIELVRHLANVLFECGFVPIKGEVV